MTGLNIIQRLRIALFKEKAKREIYTAALSKASAVNLYPTGQPDGVHFKHFGLIGDIIYAIPAMKVLAAGKKIHLHLQINKDSLYKKGMKHYNEGKILTEKSVAMLAPLLLAQPADERCADGERDDHPGEHRTARAERDVVKEIEELRAVAVLR